MIFRQRMAIIKHTKRKCTHGSSQVRIANALSEDYDYSQIKPMGDDKTIASILKRIRHERCKRTSEVRAEVKAVLCAEGKSTQMPQIVRERSFKVMYNNNKEMLNIRKCK